MRIETLTKHSAVMTSRGMEILFSYGRPVAARNSRTGIAYRTSQFFSNTTTRDIKKWLWRQYVESNQVAQKEIEAVAEKAKS